MGYIGNLLHNRSLQAFRRLKEALTNQKFKVAVVMTVGIIIWVGITHGLILGLKSLNIFPAFKDMVISYLLAMFFFVIMVMLFFSSTIVSYGSLFSGTEIPFLFAGPVPVGAIYIYRMFLAFVFSAWAVVVMGIPVVLAYGVDRKLGIQFYIAVFLAIPPFLILISSLGGIAALVLARYLGKYRRSLIGVFVIIAALGALYVTMRLPEIIGMENKYSEQWMFQILGWFAFSRSPWYPSMWIMRTLESASEGMWNTYLLYLYALCAAAFAALAFGRLLAELFYRSAYETALTASVRGRAKMNRFLFRVMRIFAFGDQRRAAFFYKDTVTFTRDPLQWGQAAIFLGLILIYFLGLKQYGRMPMFRNWRLVTTVLSFMSVALTLSTFTTRFAFPLVSIEMRVPWGIVGGTAREEMVSAKFAWTAWGSSIVSVGILWIGAQNMDVGPQATVVMLGAALGLALALSAVAVGLGTLFPEPSGKSPSEMVSSFGGTLTLVASILTVALFTAALIPALKIWIPIDIKHNLEAPVAVPVLWFTAIWICAALACLGIAVTLLVMLAARKTVRRLEW